MVNRKSKKQKAQEAFEKKEKLLKELDEYMLKKLGIGQADRWNIVKYLKDAI
jgi:hypothetical protein